MHCVCFSEKVNISLKACLLNDNDTVLCHDDSFLFTMALILKISIFVILSAQKAGLRNSASAFVCSILLLCRSGNTVQRPQVQFKYNKKSTASFVAVDFLVEATGFDRMLRILFAR